MSKLDIFYREYQNRKSEFYGAIKELEKYDLLKLSDEQFKLINKKLISMPEEKKNAAMRDLITRSIYFKLHIRGFSDGEIKKICKQILINWNLILFYNQNVSIMSLLKNAMACWEKKENELKREIERKVKKKNQCKKQVIGALRLVASGGIVAYDSSMLVKNPGDRIFFSSFWASAVLFFQGVDNLFTV